jgi:thioredoxin reductase (NADPH)
MSKPVILTVDDDPQVLAAVRRDLRSRYAADYRIVAASSGAEAVATTAELKARGQSLALFLVDQRMPLMSGTEFLVEAIKIFPGAKRLLLTAYADTDAAIQAINDVGIDHYLLKPWDPPEEKLYPVLDDVLSDWHAQVGAPFDGIRVLGATWSPSTYEIKKFLARNEVPYRYLDIERDPDAAAIVNAGTEESHSLPLVILEDDTQMWNPSWAEVAAKIGIHSSAEAPFYDLVIVGGGPAGLAAAVYGASEGLATALIEREAPGGQAGTSSRIENYLGFPKGVSGADLARRAIAQATRLGAELITAIEVTGVTVEDQTKTVHLSDGSQLKCSAIIVASGMTVRRLNVPGYEKYEGAGVYYGAAATEAATYQDKPVFVIGGANSAGQAAVMFSNTSSTVTMIVRSARLEEKMSQYLVDQIAGIENIEVLTSTQVVDVTGEGGVEQIRLKNLETGEIVERDASALFIFVGAIPHTSFISDVVATNDAGFIFTGADVVAFTDAWHAKRDPYHLETSIPGVFAAGDVREGAIRRVASAVGEGSVAVTFVHRYLATV